MAETPPPSDGTTPPTTVAVRPQRKLTTRQFLFVEEYLVDLNATQAAIRAGYRGPNVGNIASDLMGKDWIAEAIRERMNERIVRTRYTQDRVLHELAIIAFSSIADYEIDDTTGRIRLANKKVDKTAIRAVQVKRCRRKVSRQGDTETTDYETEIRLYDKLRALITFLQHLGALKQPTPVSEVDPVRELIRQLPPDVAEAIRGLLGAATGGTGAGGAGIPAIGAQSEGSNGGSTGPVPEVPE